MLNTPLQLWLQWRYLLVKFSCFYIASVLNKVIVIQKFEIFSELLCNANEKVINIAWFSINTFEHFQLKTRKNMPHFDSTIFNFLGDFIMDWFRLSFTFASKHNNFQSPNFWKGRLEKNDFSPLKKYNSRTICWIKMVPSKMLNDVWRIFRTQTH